INLCHKLQRSYKKKIYLLKRYFFWIMHNATLQLRFYILLFITKHNIINSTIQINV
ncbi:hypothetical protein ALC53_00297, partial [Atta colombica]